MVSRPLGKTGITVKPVSLGTMKIGRNTNIKYPHSFTLPSQESVDALLNRALELGVNLIDTARAYGESERRLGGFVTSHRDQIVLCTKCGEQYRNGRSTYDFSAVAITASVHESLRNLRTEYIDILLLHSDGRDLEILTQTDALEALRQLKASGKARSVGISAKTPNGILEACRTLDVVMAPFSQKEQSLARFLEKAQDAGLGILAIKGLFSGHLEAGPAIEFVLRHSFIDTLVVGTLDPAHLEYAVTRARSVEPALR